MQGKVGEGEVQCPYHGWQYNSSGSCTVMPSTAFCSGIDVDSLPCCEQQGIFWVWPEPVAAGASATELPSLPSIAQPAAQACAVLQASVQVGACSLQSFTWHGSCHLLLLYHCAALMRLTCMMHTCDSLHPYPFS